MSERIKVRIKFSKHGALKYIGHLDIMRYFQKVFRRADIDIAYTEGFSPHQVMSFAAPLGVGLESEGEYMDVELNSLVDTEDVRKRMNEHMAEGMEVLWYCRRSRAAPWQLWRLRDIISLSGMTSSRPRDGGKR